MKLGTAYYPDYFPASDWARDLDRMKAAGIETVRILEFAWSWYQPEPDRWDWDGLDRFLDLALEKGIRVCLSTPTATPPPWFFERYPDARLINIDGRPCFSARHMTCWNHPQAWAEAVRTIRTLAQRYGRHPSVWGWQIDNEPNYAEDPAAYYDFNPHAIHDAQQWLQDEYGTLDALNERWFGAFWSQTYNKWSQIWVTHLPKSNPNAALSFLRWRETNMARFVQRQAALLREATNGQKIGVNIPEVGLPFSLQIGQDYWGQATGLDWVGTDLYTATGNRHADLASLRYSCDLIRSAQESTAPNGEFLISETQGGPHLRVWRSTFASEAWGPGFLRDSLDAYAGRGATQSWLFMWRPTRGGNEIGMNGVQTFEGDDSERTTEVHRLAADPSGWHRSAASYRERPVALIHYSQDSLRYLHHFESLERADKILRGVHRALDEEGFQIRFITDRELLAGLPPAARLVLPLSPLLPPQAQDTVIRWVQEKNDRQLWLGPDTALLDGDGNWLPRDRRPLWIWLGVEPGPQVDVADTLEVDGETHRRFRVFEIKTGTVETLSSGQWRGKIVAARMRCHGRVILHAYDWAHAPGTTGGANAIPTRKE